MLAAPRAGSQRSRAGAVPLARPRAGAYPRRLSITCFAASSVARLDSRERARRLGIGVEVVAVPVRHQHQIDGIEGASSPLERRERRVGGNGIPPLVLQEERASIRTFFPPDESITPSFARKVMTHAVLLAGTLDRSPPASAAHARIPEAANQQRHHASRCGDGRYNPRGSSRRRQGT